MEEFFVSDISGKNFPVQEKVSAESVSFPVMALIKERYPGFGLDNFLSLTELNIFRELYIREHLVNEIGNLSELEHKVLNSIKDHKVITDPDVCEDDACISSFGERIADKVAKFGGSWTFIISFGIFIIVWIVVNAMLLTKDPFDPYPFILLNLFLSCLAALQAPVIMMSQNRQDAKDRLRAKEDYMVNLKSELEVRALHEKIDHLILYQQQELINIQKVQIDMLSDLLRSVNKGNFSAGSSSYDDD